MEFFSRREWNRYRYLDPRLTPTEEARDWWALHLAGQQTDFYADFEARKIRHARRLANLGSLCLYSKQLKERYGEDPLQK